MITCYVVFLTVLLFYHYIAKLTLFQSIFISDLIEYMYVEQTFCSKEDTARNQVIFFSTEIKLF